MQLNCQCQLCDQPLLYVFCYGALRRLQKVCHISQSQSINYSTLQVLHFLAKQLHTGLRRWATMPMNTGSLFFFYCQRHICQMAVLQYASQRLLKYTLTVSFKNTFHPWLTEKLLAAVNIHSNPPFFCRGLTLIIVYQINYLKHQNYFLNYNQID